MTSEEASLSLKNPENKKYILRRKSLDELLKNKFILKIIYAISKL